MPIYEYRCTRCRRRFSQFVRSWREGATPACPHCGTEEAKRLFSTFAVHHAVDPGGPMPSMESLGDVDDENPESMERWLEGVRKDRGEEFGDEYAQTVRDLKRAERTYEHEMAHHHHEGEGDEGGEGHTHEHSHEHEHSDDL